MTTTDAVTCTALGKRFGPVTALDTVDLRVAAGQVHGLLGRNGAGKTTLLRVLLGLVRPDSGTVTLLGEPSAAGRPLPAGVGGFVEAPRFYPYLTARQNLELLAALDLPGGPSVAEVLHRVGLGDGGKRKVGGFSTGMRQRLGLAAALLRSPRLLVLDEPTSGLDPAGIADLHDLVGAFARDGGTVLLSSHDMAELETLCNAVTVLTAGQVAYSGPLAELRAGAPPASFLLVTSDDAAARPLVAGQPGVETADAADGFVVHAGRDELDAAVIALGRRGIAVRSLVRQGSALEAAFARLTAEPTDD